MDSGDKLKWFTDPIRKSETYHRSKHRKNVSKTTHLEAYLETHVKRPVKLMYGLLIRGNLYVYLPSNL